MLKEEVGVENPQEEWGLYVLYRDHIPEELPGILDRKRTWKTTEQGCGVVGISFGTDCYMDPRAGEITSSTVATLADHNKHARVLTRNPVLAAQDMDVFRDAAPYVTVGSSINSLDDDVVQAIEVNAPPPSQRLRGLRKFADNDVPVYVSMSPTYPTMGREDIRNLLEEIATLDPQVVFHEPINPRGANFQMTVEAAWDAGHDELGAALAELRSEDAWVEYACNHFKYVQEAAQELDVPIHLWPDENLISLVSGDREAWLKGWFNRQSPEPFGGRDLPSSDRPSIPDGL